MKSLIVFTVLFAGLSVFAEDSKVSRSIKVDSFVSVENGALDNKSAELCGHVTGDTHLHDRVTITADHRSNQAARYTTLLSENGSFCVVLRTLRGEAQAKYWRVGEPTLSKTAETSISK